MLNALSMSAQTLASCLEQSHDCVKLLDPAGNLVWMNPNGQCAMEVDDFSALKGLPWASMWPDDAFALITDACRLAALGTAHQLTAFCPTARGTDRWWDVTVTGVNDAAGDHAGFLVVSRDITEARLAQEARDASEQEMRHRLRNSYAVVGSLVTGLARGNSSHEEFARQIAQRLHAMGSAQSLFAEHDGDVDLGELIRILAQPFDTPSCTLTVEVPEQMRVSRQISDSVALVVGELSVNSSKHGAIAHGGSISVAVKPDGASFQATWTERSHRSVERTSRPGGQGLGLIQRIVLARKGTVETEWFDDGLRTRLRLPLASVAKAAVDKDLSDQAVASPVSA